MTLAGVFDRCRAERRLALIPYLTAGFPTLDESLSHARKLAESSADIMELGIPFSDPIADGPTIQYSSQVALENGAKLGAILERLKRQPLACPVAFMSYINPLLAYGLPRLFADMKAAGVVGLIVPDLAPEEGPELSRAASEHGVSLVFLLAPTSTDERIAQVTELTRGFIYCVSLTGVTGVRTGMAEGLPKFLGRIRRVTDKPIAVGFGISKPEHVRSLQGLADGVVVGSRLVEAIRRKEDLASLVSGLKDATRSSAC